MINYASESSQSETEKYFELIIIINWFLKSLHTPKIKLRESDL